MSSMIDKTFLITGAEGQLAKSFQKILSKKRLKFCAPPEEELDITDFEKVKETIHKLKPDIIINCAAYNSVDEAETNSSIAFLVNSAAVENLAVTCKEADIFLVHYSSDYVFDGTKQDFYTEEDLTHPLNIYGESKLKGEEAIRKEFSKYLIFRLSWVFGNGSQSFLYKIYQWSKKNRILRISSDEASIPTYTEDIVNLTLMSLEEGLTGLYHLTSKGYASRYELAKYFVNKMGLKSLVIPVPMSTFVTKAKRPVFSCLSNEKISKALNITVPAWEKGVDRYVESVSP